MTKNPSSTSKTQPSMKAIKLQSQASLHDQLNELIVVAHREGLYDAADWLRTVREEKKYDH